MTQTLPQSPGPDVDPLNPAESEQPSANDSAEHLTTLALKDGLGAALTKQGRYSEAATLLREVLTTRESLNQRYTSPEMLCTMNNLAAALHHQGDFDASEALYRSVLEADTLTLGVSHPNTLVTMQNLASLLAHQGPKNDLDNVKVSEAVELLQRAEQLSQQVSGARSRQTLGIMGEQVNVLLRQERYQQAESLAREVLAGRQEVLRAHHPEIAMAVHSLVVALGKMGKTTEADALQREQLALGKIEGEKMASSGGRDGKVAIEEGRYKEAESIFREKIVTGMAQRA